MAEFLFNQNQIPSFYREGDLFKTRNPFISVDADSREEAARILAERTGIPFSVVLNATAPQNPNRRESGIDISRVNLGTPFRQVPTESLARITETDLNTPFTPLVPQALIEDPLQRIGTPTNPFAGLTTPGETPVLMVGGNVTRPSLIQGVVAGLGQRFNTNGGDGGDGGDGGGGEDGGGGGGGGYVGGGGDVTTPSESFLAVSVSYTHLRAHET